MRRLRVEAALLAALVATFYAPVLFGGRAFFERDIHAFLHDRLLVLGQALRSGTLPLWNPLPAFGEPLLAIANAQVAYPTSWLVLVLSVPATHTAIVVIHVFLAGLGAIALGRELGLSRRGASAAGALWALSGPLQSAVTQTNVLVGASWIAWAWLGFAQAGRGARGGAVLAGLGVCGTLLGGSPESAMMALAGLVFGLDFRGGLHPALVRGGRTLALSLAIGLGLSAVQWLPTLRVARDSWRSALSEESAAFWSNHPASLSQLVLPVTLDELPLNATTRARLFEGREPLLPSLYLGLGGAGLLLASLAGGAGRTRRLLLGLAIGALLLSLGRFTPLWGLLHPVPPFHMIRFPARFTLAAALPLCLLAGVGHDALAQPATRRRRFVVAAGFYALLVIAAGALAGPNGPLWGAMLEAPQVLGAAWHSDPVLLATSRRLATAALLALPVLAALALRVGPKPAARLALAASLAAALDVALATHALNPTADRRAFSTSVPALAAIPVARPNRTEVLPYSAEDAQRRLGRAAVWNLALDAPPEERLAVRRGYPAIGGTGARIEALPDDVPRLRNRDVARWAGAIVGLRETPLFPRLLQLSGVGYVLALHDLGRPEAFEPIALTPLFENRIRTYRVLGTLPRALAVTGRRVAQGQAAFNTLTDATFDARREVVLDGGEAREAGEAGRVTVLRLGLDRATVEVEMPAAGDVVLLEAWDPGWQATVDGQRAAVLRANLAFRAVAVPAGRHRVEFLYRPLEAALGALVSLASLAGLSLLLWRRRGALATAGQRAAR